MPTIKVTPRTFGAALRRRMKRDNAKLRKAALATLKRAEAAAVKETNDQGLVHFGLYKWAWKVVKIDGGYQLQNDAPYAGVIEHGRRPNRPGPPFEPILEWVERKLVANGEVEFEEAWDVAWAIRNTIHRKGTRPRYVFRSAVMNLRSWFGQEVKRYLLEG